MDSSGDFFGFPRPAGKAGVRNTVLLLPITRFANQLAWQIHRIVSGTSLWLNPGELGRHAEDRGRLRQIMIGLATNPNVAAVILCGVRPTFGYQENQLDSLVPEIQASQQNMEALMIEAEGGMQLAAARGIEIARELVWQSSNIRREMLPVSQLTIGLKCGHSDATSGLAGNPVLGRAVDRLVEQGAAVIFSETTEVIGAEKLLSERAITAEVAQDLLKMVHGHEAKAKSVGQDIRSINPIPSNIAAGITTLEEKSLGALSKTGRTPLTGVLAYGTKPSSAGLWFMDGWMSSFSLPMSLAAAGSQVVVYQFGGNDLPADAPLPAVNTGVVSPVLFTSGNPNTAINAKNGLDFDASGVITGDKDLDTAGQDLYETLLNVASGTNTRNETLRYADPTEVYFDGPFF
jgi:altronate dehydratase large subunit